MRQKPTIYLHCGFHKTGSTALQAALRASEVALRQAGFLYPYAGSYDLPGKINPDPHAHGHRNIGFEVDSHWQFNPKHGTIADISNEISSFSGHAIISVEGLESALVDPDNFSGFRTLAQETGRKLAIIVYLRDQLSYCESLYLELLKHRSIDEYRRHAAEILEAGVLRNYETLHHFNYEQILNKWTQFPGIDVLVRNYHALAGNSIITDFANLIGLDGILRPRNGEEKVNRRETAADSLCRFYHDRVPYEPTRIEKLRMDYLARNRARLTSSVALQRKFIERFQSSNLRLCRQWNIAETGLDMKDYPKPESEVTLDQFFSFETAYAIRTGTVPGSRFAPSRARQTGWMAGIETAGANIPASETIHYWMEQARRYRRWYASRMKHLVMPGATSKPG